MVAQAPRSPLLGFLDANRDAVLQTLLSRMEAVRGAPAMSREDAAFLSVFLDELKGALARDVESTAPAPPATRNPPSETARQHGRAGYAVGKTVADMVHDYGAVCDVVTDLARDAGLEMTLDDSQILNRWIDHGIADALSEYLSESDRGSAQRVGEIAHELRNALGSVTMGFRLIRNGNAPPSGRVADVVERGLATMADLIARVASDVRLRAEPKVQLSPVHLAGLIDRVVEASVPQDGVRVTMAIEGDPVVMVDERHLEAALTNLIQNGIKYSRGGGHVEVRVSISRDRVLVQVEDECGGLPEGDPEDLFAPFSRRRTDRRGLGLGLGIARRAAELHGGSLHARDLPGKGCVFELEVPLSTGA